MRRNQCPAVALAITSILSCTAILSAAENLGDPLATVGGSPVYQSEVEWEVSQSLGSLTATPKVKQRLAAEALARLIDRRIILHELAETEFRATPAELDLEMKRFDDRSKGLGTTAEEALAGKGFNAEIMRSQFDWKITWGRYLKKHLSDENLQKFYDARRQHFDGTRMKVAQILKKVSANQPDARQQASDNLSNLRTQILAGELPFAAAASSHSDSPTKDQGGVVGWIERNGPMPAVFHTAAFELKPGEISPPVSTAIGVHLITCLEVKPGDKSLQQVGAAVKQAATLYLFDYLANKGRDGVEIVK